MTKTEAMRRLRANGSEQTRKTYRRHGFSGKMFGVSYAVLGKMRKEIKVDQTLAEQLWATDNLDARTLATMIADPGKMRIGTINTWVRQAGGRGLAGAVSNVAAGSPHARKLMQKWTASSNEMTACAGWHTLASIAREDRDLPDAFFVERLAEIESSVHSSKNWVKYAMNNALINIGVRNSKLEKKAIAAARRIGKIDVDHGETSCKTPDAAAYIRKTVAYNKKKAARAKSA
jgi:3-methyladenine DNA glycosylase AlkD